MIIKCTCTHEGSIYGRATCYGSGGMCVTGAGPDNWCYRHRPDGVVCPACKGTGQIEFPDPKPLITGKD